MKNAMVPISHPLIMIYLNRGTSYRGRFSILTKFLFGLKSAAAVIVLFVVVVVNDDVVIGGGGGAQ